MEDFFGYNRTALTQGQIASSEFSVVTVGTVQNLVQQIMLNYGQDIRTVYEVGNPNIYWVPGHPEGRMDCSSLVGPNGFFAGWTGTKCGVINNLSITGGPGQCGYSTGAVAARFGGGILERVSASISAAALEIAQSASVRVATLLV